MSSLSAQLVLPVSSRDHVRGRTHSGLTLLEYGDYECPHCGAAHLVVEAVRWRMGARLRFAFRHFPLTQVHPHAHTAAEAAEAAGAQRKFWSMHDRLFAHQDALDVDSLLAHAVSIGLDVARFAEDLAEGVHRPRVREDFISGVRSGVNGTPTFFINQLRYDGPRDVASLIDALESAEAEESGRSADVAAP
jgi:protein-disulfide isomerase